MTRICCGLLSDEFHIFLIADCLNLIQKTKMHSLGCAFWGKSIYRDV